MASFKPRFNALRVRAAAFAMDRLRKLVLIFSEVKLVFINFSVEVYSGASLY